MATIEVTTEETTTTIVDVWKGSQGVPGPPGSQGEAGPQGDQGPGGEGIGNLDGGEADTLYTGDPVDGGDATSF